MYVCHCRGVTDHTIDDELDRGASSIEELADRCGAGAECGGCWPELERLLHLHAQPVLATAHR
jgi:bacterioferritin-associated ferredoxin